MFTQQAGSASRPALNGLTGIRFIAAMAVFLFHFGAGFADRIDAPEPVQQLLRNGFLGVSLFFVLSGFILTYTYQGKLALDAPGLKAFFVARFARIYPVYVLLLLFRWPQVTGELDWHQVLRVLTMTQSWSTPTTDLGYAWLMQAWTLSVEFCFYLLFPFLLVLINRLGSRIAAGCAFAVALAIVFWAVPLCHPKADVPEWWSSSAIIPLVRLSEFIYGMLLAHLFLHVGQRLGLAANAGLQLVLIAAIVGILCMTGDVQAVSIAVALMGPLLILLADERTPLARLLSLRVMVLLGGASYAMYLAQLPVRDWLRLLPGETIEQFVNPFATIGLAVLVFLFWEEPMRRRLRALFRRRGSENFTPNIP